MSAVNPPPDPAPEARQQRQARRHRWRDRALLLAPALAFGSVALTIWALVGDRPARL